MKEYEITIHYDKTAKSFRRWTDEIWNVLEDLRIQHCMNGSANRISARLIIND